MGFSQLKASRILHPASSAMAAPAAYIGNYGETKLA